MDPRRKERSSLEVEQWLLGEQSPAARARTEARLDESARCALRRDDAALRARLFARFPPERLAAEASRRHAAEKKTHTHVTDWSFGIAVAACLALLVVVRREASLPLPSEETALPTERAKGEELELRVYQSLDRGGVERRSDGESVASHDIVQVGFRRGGYPFGVVVSIDGRGAVTLHFPSEPSGSTALPSDSGELLVPDAYELDDAPGFERFILVATDEPLAPEVVLEAARSLGRDPPQAEREPLALPVRSAQRSLLLRKP